MFSPITSNMKERKELIKNSFPKAHIAEEIIKENNLLKLYYISKQMQNGIIAHMQMYVLENYQKIPLDEWNKYRFTLYDAAGRKYYFGKKYLYSKLNRDTTPISSITFTLDEHDGDFSVKINNNLWNWIDHEIIEYYSVLDNYLNPKPTPNKDNSDLSPRLKNILNIKNK